MSLAWDDLLIQDVGSEEVERWIDEWGGVLQGFGALAFLNMFGVWFVRRPKGVVDMFDVFTGEIERVAGSPEELATLVNDPAWQRVYLLSALVGELHAAGTIPKRGECYGVVPPAPLGGPNPMDGDTVPLGQVTTMSIFAWQRICAVSLRGRIRS